MFGAITLTVTTYGSRRFRSLKQSASDIGPGVIVASAAAIDSGQSIRFSLDRAAGAIAAIAADKGVSVYDFAREAEYWWRFSQASAEDYALDLLPEDFRNRNTAGYAAGPFAMHCYRTAGTHEVTLVLGFRGARYSTTMTVEVRSQAIPRERTGLFDPNGDFVADAPAHDPAARFTDIHDAAVWVDGGSPEAPRQILVRRGVEYAYCGRYNGPARRFISWRIPPNARVGTFGSGPRPVFRVCYDRGGPRDPVTDRPAGFMSWYPDADHTAIAGQTDFTHTSSNPHVYVNGVRDAAATHPDATTVRLSAPAVEGDRVLVMTGNSVSGFSKQIGEAAVTLLSGAVWDGIDLIGGYDMVHPGVFDFDHLATFEHSVTTSGVRMGLNDLECEMTLSNCRVTGFNTNVEMGSIVDGANVSNCDIGNWGNYGFYGATSAKGIALVGCAIECPSAARNNIDGKANWNTPGVPNTADHGCIRMPTSYQTIASQCRMATYVSWPADGEFDDEAQPLTRFAASATPEQSYCMTECDVVGPKFFGGSAPNQWGTNPRNDLYYVAYNIVHMKAGSANVGGSSGMWTSIGNLYIAHDVGEQNIAFFAGSDETSGVTAANIRLEQCLSINDTFIALGDRPKSMLRIARITTLQSPGIQNEIARATVTAADVANGYVDFTFTRLEAVQTQPNSRWRIWRKASPTDPDHTASSELTWSERLVNWTLRSGGGATLVNSEDTERAFVASLRVAPVAAAALTEGEAFIITREQVAIEDGDTYPTNNIAEPLVRPAPRLINPLVVVPGNWASVEMREGDGLLDASAIEALRPDAFGAFDEYWRPLAGNAALRASEAQIHAVFGIGLEDRPAEAAAGALEPASPVDAAPFYRMPKGVALGFAKPALAGATVGLSDIVLTAGDAGYPALSFETLDVPRLTVRRAGADLPESESYLLEADDIVFTQAAYGHPLSGRKPLALAQIARTDPFVRRRPPPRP
jgi:hypothetical protein